MQEVHNESAVRSMMKSLITIPHDSRYQTDYQAVLDVTIPHGQTLSLIN